MTDQQEAYERWEALALCQQTEIAVVIDWADFAEPTAPATARDEAQP